MRWAVCVGLVVSATQVAHLVAIEPIDPSQPNDNTNLFPSWVSAPTFIPLYMMKKKDDRKTGGIASLAYDVNTNPLTVSLNMGQAIHGLGGVKGLRGGSLKRMYWGNQMHSFFENNNDLAGFSFPKAGGERKIKTPNDAMNNKKGEPVQSDLERAVGHQEDPDVERVRAFQKKMSLKYYHGDANGRRRLEVKMDNDAKTYEAKLGKAWAHSADSFRGHHLKNSAPSLKDLEKETLAMKKKQHKHVLHGPGMSSGNQLDEFWARKGGNGMPSSYGHPDKQWTSKKRKEKFAGFMM